MTYRFKDPKTVEEQIDYLIKNKRVVFNKMSKKEASNILYKYNYINVISPFKYVFFKKDKNGEPIRDENGNHIYEQDVDFTEYYQLYRKERDAYPTIYKNISEFETIFKASTANEIINFYNLNDSEKFNEFINLQKNQIPNTSYKINMKEKINDALKSIEEKMNTYKDIYILFDRMSFNEMASIFRLAPQHIKEKIYRSLLNNKMNYGCSSFGQLDNMLKIFIPIRNYVCHENSLTILTRYYDIQKHTVRVPNDRKKYQKLIQKLSIEKAGL